MTTADPTPTEALAAIRGALAPAAVIVTTSEGVRLCAVCQVRVAVCDAANPDYQAKDQCHGYRTRKAMAVALPVLERALAASPPRVGLRPAREVVLTAAMEARALDVPYPTPEFIDSMVAMLEADRQGGGLASGAARGKELSDGE